MTHTVRTTRWPDRDIEVDDAEYLDLQRWGQIIPAPQPEPEPPAAVDLPVEPEPEPVAPENLPKPRRRDPRQ
jgi:hypothetical protein